MPTVESEQVEIEAEKRRETDRAVLLWDGRVTVWVPKSQAKPTDQRNVWRMPEWLALAKGLI